MKTSCEGQGEKGEEEKRHGRRGGRVCTVVFNHTHVTHFIDTSKQKNR